MRIQLTAVFGIGIAAMSLSGCGGSSAPTPTAVPTAGRVYLNPMPTPTITSTPTDTPTPTATPTATATPLPTPLPTGPEATLQALQDKCDVPTEPDMVAVAPVDDAPDDAKRAWTDAAEHAFTADVVAHDDVGKAYRLRATEPPQDFEVQVTYTGDPLPIEMGRGYRFTYWSDPPDSPPSGTALRIEDERGVLFLNVSVRETEGASQRILGGDRAGFAVRQSPSLCRRGPMGPCGYEHRAAPLEVARGDLWLTLAAGESGAFAVDPPYVVSVATSHHRVPIGAVSCPDPTDWVQSYRITRGESEADAAGEASGESAPEEGGDGE